MDIILYISAGSFRSEQGPAVQSFRETLFQTNVDKLRIVLSLEIPHYNEEKIFIFSKETLLDLRRNSEEENCSINFYRSIIFHSTYPWRWNARMCSWVQSLRLSCFDSETNVPCLARSKSSRDISSSYSLSQELGVLWVFDVSKDLTDN